MAEILSHPKKDELTDEQSFEYAEGTVIIRTKDGSPLDLKMAKWLLDSTAFYIMKLSFEEP